MTTHITPHSGEQLRRTVQLARQERLRQQNRDIGTRALSAIVLPDALPNDEGTEENLIETAKLSEDLNAQISTAWNGTGRSRLRVYFNEGTTPFFSQDYETTPSFPLAFTLPSSNFQSDGVYSLHYTLQNNAGLEESDRITFTVDKTDPNRNITPAALRFNTDRIDLQYLTDNNGLPFTLPVFSRPLPGDRADIFLLPPNGASAVLVAQIPARPVAGFDPTTPMGGIIAKDKFVDANGDPVYPDGVLQFYYFAYSRAGNETRRPADSILSVAFKPLPTGLADPVIPLAVETTPLIDRADAIVGVNVQIPAFTNHQPNDEITVIWGSRSLAPFKVGTNPVFPLESPLIPYTTLLSEGTETGEGPKDVTATYRVLRGLLPFTPPAGATTEVDLRIPGPENPGPGPENPALGELKVFGGGPSPEENKIRVEDINLPVSVRLPAYAPLTAGEVLQVFWNDKEVPSASHTVIGDETEFDIEVPFAFVAAQGDGPRIPVYIQLTSPALPPGNAPTTVKIYVEVDTFQLGAMTPAAFPDMDDFFMSIGCCERIWEGAKLQVLGDPVNFSKDDTITVYWQGRATDDSEIPDTSGSEVFTLTEQQATDGFEYRIAFSEFVQPIADVDGQLHAWYTLKKTGGQTATADPVNTGVAYVMPSGCKCTAAGACDISLCPPTAKNANR